MGDLHPRHRRDFVFLLWLVTLMFAAVAAKAQTSGRQLLRGNAPVVVGSLQPVGRLASDTSLRFAISLPLRNQEALDARLQAL